RERREPFAATVGVSALDPQVPALAVAEFMQNLDEVALFSRGGGERSWGVGGVMDLGLRGKIALVTGANRGIGLAIAMELAREGCDLAVCGRGADTLSPAAERIRALGVRVAAIQADVLSAADAQRLVEEAA